MMANSPKETKFIFRIEEDLLELPLNWDFLSDNFESIKRQLGVKLRLQEKGSYKSGKDTMHELWIYPEK